MSRGARLLGGAVRAYAARSVAVIPVIASGPTRQHPPISRAPARSHPPTCPAVNVELPVQARARESQTSPLFG